MAQKIIMDGLTDVGVLQEAADPSLSLQLLMVWGEKSSHIRRVSKQHSVVRKSFQGDVNICVLHFWGLTEDSSPSSFLGSD